MIARQPAHQSVDSTRFKGVKSQRVTTFFIVLPDISRNAAGDPFCRLMDGVARQMRVAPATQLRPGQRRAHACPFRIMCIASYPWIVRCAAWNSRKPCLAFTRRLILMILLQDVVQVSDRPISAAAAQDSFPFHF